jgi:hypothetical protein
MSINQENYRHTQVGVVVFAMMGLGLILCFGILPAYQVTSDEPQKLLLAVLNAKGK